MQPLNHYKTNRLWNINANIVVADILSTAGTALIIEAIRAKLPTSLAIVAVTAVIDGAISLAVFAGLHTYANSHRGMKDLFRVQLHRWVLSPLHYLIGSGLQFTLLAVGVGVGIGVLVSYLSAVAIVRTIHTLYGKRSGLFTELPLIDHPPPAEENRTTSSKWKAVGSRQKDQCRGFSSSSGGGLRPHPIEEIPKCGRKHH